MDIAKLGIVDRSLFSARWTILDKEWREDLIWCPSQLYRGFEITGPKCYLEARAYLRWRHSDPWTAAIIPKSDGCNHFWFPVDELPEFKQYDYKDAENWMEEWIGANPQSIAGKVRDNIIRGAKEIET